MSAWEILITVQSNVDYGIVVIACRNFCKYDWKEDKMFSLELFE